MIEGQHHAKKKGYKYIPPNYELMGVFQINTKNELDLDPVERQTRGEGFKSPASHDV